MTRTTPLLGLFAFTIALLAPAISFAEDAKPTADQQALFEKFSETLTGSTLIGKFTIVGRDMPPKEERYDIKSVHKLEEADLWLFNARVKYGDKDAVIPMPLEVKWAGKTPVITLDNVAIPGLGTFSAHVVIDGDKYAGTWTHGEVSGHLFGRIEKTKSAPAE
ncbi:hypothetical protein LOC68_12775 [Blastopirellula sp. JC732]|uniref:DUF3299 domain-containing protein n=1 Tax=Blastopirellula sediminis TaxID=2894196 RepID=A0A9X1MN25_9BACT|nr:hypothetical protein [Blastopirellula sediminis]MCC9607437.1 hypothetical protein [Blastopirellula sediminis]MCC9629270.1 hypothetical protein [Blastopirellula sediminis]